MKQTKNSGYKYLCKEGTEFFTITANSWVHAQEQAELWNAVVIQQIREEEQL